MAKPALNRGAPAAKAAPHLALGRAGEEAACALLRRAGLRILDRNWRQGRLELDMVCQDGATVVFVEVKTRASRAHGGPEGAITQGKRRNLCRAAQAWLAAHDAWDAPCRFDVVCLVAADGTFTAEHYRHAFDFAPSLDSGHAPWQPW